MTEKLGYFEEMRQQQVDAGIRLLKRKIDEGVFPDNDDTVNAFSAGWFGIRDYDRARKTLNDAATGSSAFSMVLFLYGGMAMLLPLLAYVGNSNAVAWDRASWLIGSGSIGVLLGLLLVKRARRLNGIAHEKFAAEWSRLPSSKKTSDEAKVTVDE